MIFITAIFVAAALTLQLLEMKEYNLFETLQKTFFPEKSMVQTTPPAEAPKTPASD
jgi:hypothetical protein